MRVSFYFGQQHRATFGPMQTPLIAGVVTLTLPDSGYEFDSFSDILCSGWFRCAEDIQAFARGLVHIHEFGDLLFLTPVPVTILPRSSVRHRMNFTFQFTSDPAEIQAAIDRYGQAGVADLRRQLGPAPDLADFDSEGGMRN